MLWPCAGDCWSNLAVDAMLEIDNLWACPSCTASDGNCAYGSYSNAGHACVDCLADWKLKNMAMIGTNSMVKGCWLQYAVCDKGYYNTSTGPSDYGACASCLSVPPVNCGKGRFQKRCVRRQEDTDNLDELCGLCDNPALPEPTRAHRYGLGRVYLDCSTWESNTMGRLDPSACAWFLTPMWEMGKCDVECNAGYLPVNFGHASLNCTVCKTQCSAGFKPPYCPGGSEPVLGKIGACEECTDLPLHARWVSGGQSCDWECADGGFYKGVFSCLKCDILQTCLSPTSKFMGCNGNSSGKCIECSIADCDRSGASYLRSDISMDRCLCVSCSTPVIGITYILKNCSLESDAVLGMCTLAPCGRGFYLASGCSMWRDAACVPCSQPTTQGRLLVSHCTPLTDAVYGDCPLGRGCNGTTVTFGCAEGRSAEAGVCVCSAATTQEPLSGLCVPIVCNSSGMYPDPKTGICQNCTQGNTTIVISTVEGVLGLNACKCPAGFFVQLLESSIKCWPCGDLGCLRGLQRQSECVGLEKVEPTCKCAPAPGAELIDANDIDSECTVRCASGYHRHPSATFLSPGLYDKFNFVTNVLPDSYSRVQLLKQIHNIQDIALVGVSTAVVLHDRGLLSLVHLDSGAVAKVNSNILMSAPNLRFEMGSVTSILSHSGGGGYLWIAFTYWGLCEDVDAGLEQNCSAVELALLQPHSFGGGGFCVGEGLDICMTLTSGIWGNNFPAIGTNQKIYSMALGPEGNSLFMALGGHGDGAAWMLFQYVLTFYQASVPSSNRKQDPLEKIGEYENGGIVDISFGSNRIYTLIDKKSTIAWFSLFSKTWESPLQSNATTIGASDNGNIVQLSEHLILIQVQDFNLKVLDLLNNLAAVFYVSSVSQILVQAIGFKDGKLVGVAGDGSYLVIYTSVGACPVDTIIYQDEYSNGCVPMQCVLSEPCGPHSVRGAGETTCVCEPGYFTPRGYVDSSVLCLPCAQASSSSVSLLLFDFYCPGDLTSVACPAHSKTSSQFATSVADCLCVPGYYHFGSYCLPCPTNMWCPVEGTMAPIPCYAKGTTLSEGTSFPIYCICPERTYGLLCQPCEDENDCIFIGSPTSGLATYLVPTLTSVNVRGVGPIWGDEIADGCMAQAIGRDMFLIYSILGVSLSQSALVSTILASDLLIWDWVFVFRDPTPEAYENVSSCLGMHGFEVETFRVLGAPTEGKDLRVSVSCGGRNWEWSGLTSSPCTCVGGYEPRMTSTWGIKCFPCLQDTVRSRRSTGGCVSCEGENEHAPYLGMKECVCVEGYKRFTTTGACVDARESAPSWYADVSSPTVVVTLVVVFGCFVVAVSVLAAYCL